MSVSNTSRFSIYKNAIEYIKEVPTLIAKNNICTPKDYTFVYDGDTDFKPFFRIDSDKTKSIVKVYQDTDLLLQNIYWDDIYESIEKTVLEILEKIAKTGSEKKLSIINITPIEWAIIWMILRELGLKNVVFNFNRTLQINSTAKTLEAILYIFSYENSPFFKEKTSKIVKGIQEKHLNIHNENNYIIIDENNHTPAYTHLSIDDYLKHQIGEKDPKNIYRIDKYPDENFLLSKWIGEVVVFDNDSDYWQAYSYYEATLNTVKLKKESYWIFQKTTLWYYEDYLTQQDKDYKKYKKEIEKKAYNSYKVYQNSPQTWKQTDNRNMYLGNQKKEKSDEKDYKILPYILVFPILMIAFFMADSSPNGNIWNTGGGSGWWGWGSFIWNSIGWWGGSSISTSSSNKSIIKSFGGWGFSKWST